jgi:hypothetical protein
MPLNSYSSKSKSGTVTVTDTATDLGTLANLTDAEDGTNGIVVLQVASSEAAGIEVLGQSGSTGLLIPNDSALYSIFVDDMSKIKLKRQGGSDISCRFYAF